MPSGACTGRSSKGARRRFRSQPLSGRPPPSQAEQPFRVVVQELPFDALARRKTANDVDGLRALTGGRGAFGIGTVAAEQELVLMPHEEIPREALVPRERVEP